MLRKFFVVPAILSLACLLMLTDFAQAQRRGGGRGGYNGGYRGGVGVYIGPSYGYGYYPYRTYDSYYYSPSYYPPTYYSAPAVEYVQPVQPATVIADYANIRVLVADPAARVWFDDRLTSQQGTDRMFNTPSLTSTGTYRIRATWMRGNNEVAAERIVTVSPGQTVVVDFTR